MVICIDFDGTIVEHQYPAIGKLKLGAKEVINALFENKHDIIIFTCRSNKNSSEDDLLEAEEFLIENKINFTKINRNSDKVTYGCWPKLYADIYIDDRNLFHQDSWSKIRKALVEKGALQ